MIHVCSLARLHDTVAETRASHIVTLLRLIDRVQRPTTIRRGQPSRSSAWTTSAMPMDGYTHPAEEHVHELIDFVQRWDRRAPMVMHCYAGISRSTAGAFISACALNPGRDEAAIARAIRGSSKTAMPNIMLVGHADRILGRNGRMIAAVEALGPGLPALEGRTLPARSGMIHDRRMDRAMIDQTDAPLTPIEVGLTAAIVAVEAEEPRILVAADPKGGTRAGLPFGPFDPLSHRTFEIGLRNWVAAQTALNVGYVEQLYTFGDRGRHARPDDTGMHMISVGYLALTRMSDNAAALREAHAGFEPWYRFFPVGGLARRPARTSSTRPSCRCWSNGRKTGKSEPPRPLGRRERLRHCFARRRLALGRGEGARPLRAALRSGTGRGGAPRRPRGHRAARARSPPLGEAMRFDHRRILATAIARLRAKLKYRPVVFELMPDEFTLTELQRTVEAISGRHLHKQNFRRLVETAALVEPTGETSTATGGRPAAQFRFRREVVQERPAPGLRFGGRS